MSQPKYNIRLNAPKPSEDEIREFKNFNRILHQYKRAKRPRPLHSIMGKMNRLIPIIIIILSLLLFLFYYLQFAQQHKKEQELIPVEQSESANLDFLEEGQLQYLD